MSKRKKLSATSESVDKAFGTIGEALRATGRLLPECADDVNRSESDIDIDGVELPELLRDPMATLARGREILKDGLWADRSERSTESRAVRRHLTRAARNGKVISSEVQARMLRDRQAANKTKKG